MEWHFGYNCKHWVPMPGSKPGISPLGAGKCRVKIADYNKRDDLQADKPKLKAREVLAYTGYSPQELVAQVKWGKVRAERAKKPVNPERDGYWRFRLTCSWEWDDCALSETGGRCVSFEPHDRAQITCIADIRHIGEEHPNTSSDDDWRLVEERLTALLAEGWSASTET